MAKSKTVIHDIAMVQEAVAFDVEAFDSLIESNGIALVHYRAAPCPIGVMDANDGHAHSTHDNCSNGFIYDEAGTCTSAMMNNSSAAALEDIGIMDGSTVNVILPRFYDDSNKEVSVQDYDRFYMKDAEVYRMTSQRYEHHMSGLDRLRYPAIDVDFLMDSTGKRYTLGVDFVLENGSIRWLGNNRPGFDPRSERGDVCSVRYRYCPYWYVKTILHEVRVTRDVNPITGETKLVRMPHAVLLQREYVFENEEKAVRGKADARDVRGPRKGRFGPR